MKESLRDLNVVCEYVGVRVLDPDVCNILHEKVKLNPLGDISALYQTDDRYESIGYL